MILTRPLRSIFPVGLFFLLSAFCLPGCDAPQTKAAKPTRSPGKASGNAGEKVLPDSLPSSPSSFDLFLQTDFPPADGFTFPLGDPDEKGNASLLQERRRHGSWQVTRDFVEQDGKRIALGEEWRQEGSKSPARGEPVRAVANGRIITARDVGSGWGNVVEIEHLFYENHEKKTVRSLYAHLDSIRVREGELVRGKQPIGIASRLYLEIRTDTILPPTYRSGGEERNPDRIREEYAEPGSFIREHLTLFVPQNEKRLVLVDQDRYRMRFYNKGKIHGEYDLSFGQTKGGRKRVEGDKRTPRGMYFITEREQGEKITGPTAPYMGGYWLKLNYPNMYDADWGYGEGHITREERESIASLWKKRKGTPQKTRLGGGIGIHGWIREWDNTATRHRSWGCIVMHNRDIPTIYDLIPTVTMVVIW